MIDRRPIGTALLVTVALAPLLASCQDGVLDPPETEDALFARYVAMGNSITAGFQSGGINEETQRESYAVLLAERMGAEFGIPAFAAPGCPPPIADPLTGERAGGADPDDCALRQTPAPEVLNNVAVPGASTLDAFDNLDEASSPGPLNPLILGGRTQVEAARAADPTFLTVWIGNNDALGTALAGTVTDETLTPLDLFEDRYETLAGELDALDEPEALLVGVAHPVFLPHLSFGAAYWELHQAGQLPDNFEVDGSCSLDGEENGLGASLVPFGYGFGELLVPALQDPDLEVELNCAEDEPVLRPDEQQEVTARILSYNEAIASEAAERDWAFLDPNPIFAQLDQMQLIPPFPDLDNPVELFGPVFSLDGIHPNAELHTLAARELIQATNEHYDTELDPPEVPWAPSEAGSDRARALAETLHEVVGAPTRSELAEPAEEGSR